MGSGIGGLSAWDAAGRAGGAEGMPQDEHGAGERISVSLAIAGRCRGSSSAES